MEIKNLENVAFDEVLECFLAAFDNYFVQLPTEASYWEKRFFLAGVNWELSYGVFDKDRLVAFIINGIGERQRIPTAYNTGTGVLPDYRRQGLIEKIYDHAIPILKEQGIEQCLLEVIMENKVALRLYERIGFRVSRELRSFQGTVSSAGSRAVLKPSTFDQLPAPKNIYCWDNSAEAIRRAGEEVKVFRVEELPGREIGYFCLGPGGNVLQLEAEEDKSGLVLDAIGQITSEIKIKNLPEDREELLSELQRRTFNNVINQFEMERQI